MTPLFYQKPVPLNKETHSKLHFKKFENLAFAADANSIPVAGFEFFSCGRHHPVMFIQNKTEDFIPVALVSLTPTGHNLGDNWSGVYIPAYLRRYPFILEEKQGILMFDEDCGRFSSESGEGEALFDEKGESTPALQEILKFVQYVDRGYRATEQYSKALKEKGLLKPCKNTIKFTDNTLKLDNLYVVEEQDFVDSLSDAEVADWFKKGWIAWTYAHLNSVGSLPELIKRLPRKEEEPAKA
ncbi:MAG: SapC family protein [Agarilytica sp.]